MKTGIAVVVFAMLMAALTPAYAQREGGNYMAPLGSCGLYPCGVTTSPWRPANIAPNGKPYDRTNLPDKPRKKR